LIHYFSDSKWILTPLIVDLAVNDVIKGKLFEWLGCLSWFELPNEWNRIWAKSRTEIGIICCGINAFEDTASVANEGAHLKRVIIGFVDVIIFWKFFDDIIEVSKETNGLDGDTILLDWDNWVLRYFASLWNEMSLLDPSILVRSEG